MREREGEREKEREIVRVEDLKSRLHVETFLRTSTYRFGGKRFTIQNQTSIFVRGGGG